MSPFVGLAIIALAILEAMRREKKLPRAGSDPGGFGPSFFDDLDRRVL